jgi:hypothetical protein
MNLVLGYLARRFPKLAREVVAQRVVLVAVLAAALHVAVARHWITPALSGSVSGDLTNGIDGLAVLVGAAAVRAGVTPTKDPRAKDGTPLEPAGSDFDAGQDTTVAEPEPAEFDAPDVGAAVTAEPAAAPSSQ